MARIIYKVGCEGQNKLSCIEGIEIELLNGQKALIYPKYAKRLMLKPEQISKWNAEEKTEIEALKVTDATIVTEHLRSLDSPAAVWASRFYSDNHGIFLLPSLLAALEIQHQRKEIDALAETIEGADLLRDCFSILWSCSWYSEIGCWVSTGLQGCATSDPRNLCLVVPTILYR